jgi:hypothetical protein
MHSASLLRNPQEQRISGTGIRLTLICVPSIGPAVQQVNQAASHAGMLQDFVVTTVSYELNRTSARPLEAGTALPPAEHPAPKKTSPKKSSAPDWSGAFPGFRTRAVPAHAQAAHRAHEPGGARPAQECRREAHCDSRRAAQYRQRPRGARPLAAPRKYAHSREESAPEEQSTALELTAETV